MKTRKTVRKQHPGAVRASAPAPSRPPARKRRTGVRGRILELLQSGARTRSDLVRKGGFSAASLYLNLKALKKEGRVVTTRHGRSVLIALADAPHAAIEGVVLPVMPKAATKTGRTVVAAYVPRELHEALESLQQRLAPVERSEEKLLVLEQLALTLPAPIAAVLQDIMADLARLSANRAG